MTEAMMTETLDQIRRGALHDELLDRLRRLIVEGTLAPGSKVNEQALCDRFAVSRTPLREALRSLAAEGLVVLTPRRGASIAPLTRQDLEEAFPIAGALEALAGELACQNITDAEIIHARALLDQLIVAQSGGDMKRYRSVNKDIHQLILKGARNPTLARMLRSLDGRVQRARYLANMSEMRWAAAVAEHEEIQARLEARDATGLSDALRNHIANKLQSLFDQLQI